jgi:hypothetical protein
MADAVARTAGSGGAGSSKDGGEPGFGASS